MAPRSLSIHRYVGPTRNRLALRKTYDDNRIMPDRPHDQFHQSRFNHLVQRLPFVHRRNGSVQRAQLLARVKIGLATPRSGIIDPPADRWPSGRRRAPGKCVGGRPSRGFESLPVRHIQLPNPSKGPDWGLFSFCFKGRWPGYPPFGDWTLDAECVSEWPSSLFERPSMVTGRRKTSSYFQWVAAFIGSSRSRHNLMAETDTKAQDGRRSARWWPIPKSGASVRREPGPCQKSLMTNRLRAHSLRNVERALDG